MSKLVLGRSSRERTQHGVFVVHRRSRTCRGHAKASASHSWRSAMNIESSGSRFTPPERGLAQRLLEVSSPSACVEPLRSTRGHPRSRRARSACSIRLVRPSALATRAGPLRELRSSGVSAARWEQPSLMRTFASGISSARKPRELHRNGRRTSRPDGAFLRSPPPFRSAHARAQPAAGSGRTLAAPKHPSSS